MVSNFPTLLSTVGLYIFIYFGREVGGGGLGRTVGDCKQIGVGLGPAHQPPPLCAISGYAPERTRVIYIVFLNYIGKIYCVRDEETRAKYRTLWYQARPPGIPVQEFPGICLHKIPGGNCREFMHIASLIFFF